MTATQNPHFFIVGCARSGTTLLQRIVNAHPSIAVTPEAHWITNFKESKRLMPPGWVTSDLVSKLLEHKRFAQLEITPDEFKGLVRSGQRVSHSDFLAGVFDLYRRAKAKPLVGNKTPDYVVSIRTLHGLWPTAKFIHIIRDGRDVCLSILNWKKADRTAGRFETWVEDPVSTTALWWERKVRLGQDGGRSLTPNLYYELRYESLVARPAEECAKLCAFLSVPFEDAMLRFHETATSVKPGRGGKRACQPITPALRDWRSQMRSEDVERFEAVVGDFLDELGYPRAVPHPRTDTVAHAARIRGLFTRGAQSRGRMMPERWSA